jgi:hypothetical protein
MPNVLGIEVELSITGRKCHDKLDSLVSQQQNPGSKLMMTSSL